MPDLSVPVPQTRATAPFWDAARDQRFVLPRCRECGKAHWYPRHTCPYCWSAQIGWDPASGRAEVVTFAIVRQNFATAGVQRPVPYVVAIVRVEEGPLMTTNIVDCAPEDVRIGLPVEVRFEEVGLEVLVPVFRPQPAGELASS